MQRYEPKLACSDEESDAGPFPGVRSIVVVGIAVVVDIAHVR